ELREGLRAEGRRGARCSPGGAERCRHRRRPVRRRGLRDRGPLLARRGPAERGRRRGVQGRPHHRVLAARVVLRPAHRRTHQPAGHRAGVRLPGPRGGGGRVRRCLDRRQPPRRGQQL
ncbi:MAG: Ferredoxin, 2Fe-2S, partial [uncultured Blastococcus sp.]